MPIRRSASWTMIALYGGLGSIGALIGGHAVGGFADHLVVYLRSEGYSEMIGAILFAFPTLLILWKSIGDDGSVNRLETVIMLALFGMVLYFLAVHG